MSETVDALRETWACQCGADWRAKQRYSDAERVAIERECLGHGDVTILLFIQDGGRVCRGCPYIPWRLQPEAPFTLTKRNERALACSCGGGGERAKQDLKLAQDAFLKETDRPGIPPHTPVCSRPPVGCNASCWYIQPGVEAVVPGIAPVQVECSACGGAGKVAASPVHQSVIRRYCSLEE